MENTQEKILSEIKDLVKEIRIKAELLENKYIELEKCVSCEVCSDMVLPPVSEEDEPIDIDLGMEDVFSDGMPESDDVHVETEEEFTVLKTELPALETDFPAFESELPALETELLSTGLPVLETEPPALETDLPSFESELPALKTDLPSFESELPALETELLSTGLPVLETEPPVLESEPPVFETELPSFETESPVPETESPVFSGLHKTDEPAAPVAVVDVLTEKQAWRRDLPGAAVNDVRSAISLNDRILFIKSLFSGDAVLFQNTLDRINSAGSFEDALGWLMPEFGGWNFESDTVYRFMMAVRRKLK